jgi:hypothetical protein
LATFFAKNFFCVVIGREEKLFEIKKKNEVNETKHKEINRLEFLFLEKGRKRNRKL